MNSDIKTLIILMIPIVLVYMLGIGIAVYQGQNYPNPSKVFCQSKGGYYADIDYPGGDTDIDCGYSLKGQFINDDDTTSHNYDEFDGWVSENGYVIREKAHCWGTDSMCDEVNSRKYISKRNSEYG